MPAAAQNDISAMHSEVKKIICISWIPTLATTRTMLLRNAGYAVLSLTGPSQIDDCCVEADLLILAHSVPTEIKKETIRRFRAVSRGPVLSLLAPNQIKLPEADFGVDASNPDDFLEAVKQIIPPQ